VRTSRTKNLAQLVFHHHARGCVNSARVCTSTVHPRLPNQTRRCQHQDIINSGRTLLPPILDSPPLRDHLLETPFRKRQQSSH
jgi:hypothetical protein